MMTFEALVLNSWMKFFQVIHDETKSNSCQIDRIVANPSRSRICQQKVTIDHSTQTITANCSCICSHCFTLCFLYDGIARLVDFMNDSPLTFVVNNCRFVSNVAEAVLLSPTIHQHIRTDITMQDFVLQDELITADDFSIFLKCVRGFQVELCQSHKSSFLTISRKFCNSRLEIFFLSIFGDSCDCERFSIDSSRGFDVNISAIASQFYIYSNDEL
jgi:hypothetical protein